MRYRTNCDRDNDRGSVKKSGITYMGILAASLCKWVIGDGLNKRNCLTIDNRQVWILWCVGISVLYTELNAALGVRWTDMWNKVRNMVVKLVWYLPNVQRSCDTLKSILWKCRPVPTYTMSLGKDSSYIFA